MWRFACGSNLVWRNSLIPLGTAHLCPNYHSTKALALPLSVLWWRHRGWRVTENTLAELALEIIHQTEANKHVPAQRKDLSSPARPSPHKQILKPGRTIDLVPGVEALLLTYSQTYSPGALQASSLWRYLWSLQEIVNPHPLERCTTPDQLAPSSSSLSSPSILDYFLKYLFCFCHSQTPSKKADPIIRAVGFLSL